MVSYRRQLYSSVFFIWCVFLFRLGMERNLLLKSTTGKKTMLMNSLLKMQNLSEKTFIVTGPQAVLKLFFFFFFNLGLNLVLV